MTYLSTCLTHAKTIELQTKELPNIVPPGEVRLALATASLCGTDLHYYRHFANAGFELNNPVTLGHEACARVVDANESDLKVGQLVALNPVLNCTICDSCKNGQENFCTSKRFPGSATTVPHIDGFFREHFDFPASACHPVADTIDPDHLTFAEPLACAMHAVTISKAGPGTRVMVTGCGPMGLLTVVAAKAVGADVAVTDMRQEAADLAKTIGASSAYLSNDPALEHLNGSFDVVIEASGSPHAINQSLELVKRQGKLVILSMIQPSTTPINLHRITLKEIDVTGSMQFNSEFKKAVQLVTSGKVDFDRLIAARFSLKETGAALALMETGGASGKILIKPE